MGCQRGGGGGGGDRVRGQVWDGTLSEQSMVRKVWAMTALKSRLQKEATASPQERVSRGWISVGYIHPKGPQDHAYALQSPHSLKQHIAARDQSKRTREAIDQLACFVHTKSLELQAGIECLVC